jgi:hypothetical protein
MSDNMLKQAEIFSFVSFSFIQCHHHFIFTCSWLLRTNDINEKKYRFCFSRFTYFKKFNTFLLSRNYWSIPWRKRNETYSSSVYLDSFFFLKYTNTKLNQHILRNKSEFINGSVHFKSYNDTPLFRIRAAPKTSFPL